MVELLALIAKKMIHKIKGFVIILSRMVWSKIVSCRQLGTVIELGCSSMVSSKIPEHVKVRPDVRPLLNRDFLYSVLRVS